jgi:tetratricopeptide (TPR) repeat protein
MRRVPEPDAATVDETATADRIAEQPVRHRLWVPALRPVSDRWLDLSLVVDTGDSMAVWSQLTREFQDMLLETGIFRRVTIWSLDTGNPRRVTVTPGTVMAPGRGGQPPGAVPRAGNRHVILVLSDCTGAAWHGGAARNALSAWGRTAPVAILQPLPERLWSRTGAPTTVGRLVSGSRCAPNSDLTFFPFDDLASPPDGAVAVPVLEIRPAWIRRWANVVAGPGVGDPLAVTYLTTRQVATQPEPEPPLTPQQRVREFRASASPQAFRLARCLATTTPTLPVMRLVQRAVLGTSGSSLIAEVVLGGLLRAVDGRTGRYEFVDGIREVLLDAVPRSEATKTMGVLARVSADLERDAGLSPRTFRAFVTGLPSGPGGATVDSLAFALINRDALRRMLHRPGGNDEPLRPVVPVVPEESGPPIDPRPPAGLVEGLPRIWHGVPIRNPHFTGRESLLRRLRGTFSPQGRPSGRVLLHGLGGVGKTQVATEYVYRHADEYDLVWWLPAERATDVLNSLAALGRRIRVPTSGNLQQTARSVLEALASTSYKWLLVYDNAERPEEISELIPAEGGAAILTSRNPDWTDRYPGIEVDVFERAESIDLLLQLYGSAGSVSRDTANLLADKLGDLPLALEQAVNFQLATGMSCEEYLELFDQRVRELLSEGRPAAYPTTVAAFLTMAFASLREADPAAAELLELFAYFGPEPMPTRLLRRGRSAGISPVLGRVFRDPVRLGRTARSLVRYGLVRWDPSGRRVQMHRLVQAVLRDSLDEPDQARTLASVRNLLAAVNPSDADDWRTWDDHAELGPHVMAADLIHSEHWDARLVVIDQARYLFMIGDYGGSRRLGEVMVAEWSKSPDAGGLGPDHEQTLLARRHLANALKMFGEYDESLRLDQQTFQAVRAGFGDDHEHAVAVAFGLGFDLRMAGDGDLVGSLESDRENLARATRVYGPQGDETVRATTNLAAGLRAAGRFQEAYELSSQAVEARRETLGDNNRLTVWSVSEQVRDLFGLGRYQEALRTQQRAANLYQHLFRPHERQRLLAERNLVILLRKTGDHGAALVRARENHEAFKTHFGSEHEYTLAARMGLANALRAAGRLAEARSTGAEALEGYRRKFGPRHWLTLAAQVNQGIILRLLREREAGELERATFHALTATVGEEHPFTLCAAVNYASSLSLGHEVVAARELTERTLEISQRVRGEDHPDTLACALNAALDEQASGEDPAGQQRLDSVMDAFQRVLGADHPDTIDAIRGKRADCDLEPPPT